MQRFDIGGAVLIRNKSEIGKANRRSDLFRGPRMNFIIEHAA
jgi:hypothetical protein